MLESNLQTPTCWPLSNSRQQIKYTLCGVVHGQAMHTHLGHVRSKKPSGQSIRPSCLAACQKPRIDSQWFCVALSTVPLDDGDTLTALAADTRMQLACLIAVHSCDGTASAKPGKDYTQEGSNHSDL